MDSRPEYTTLSGHSEGYLSLNLGLNFDTALFINLLW